MAKNFQSNGKASIAPGMDTEDELKKDATETEIDKGESTRVTTLSLDENDPS
jgi:hypothetical protein